MTRLDILFVQRADPGQRRFEGGLLGRADYAVNPCAHCDSRCCTLRAFLTVPEALRITFTLGVPFPEFIEVAVEAEDCVLDERWGKALKLDEGRAQLSHRRGEGGYCKHAMRPGERTSHCGIYGLRPAVCRLYPFAFQEAGDEEAPIVEVGNQRKCPVLWLVNDEMQAQVEADYDAWQRDLALDKKIVTRWNRGRRKDRSVEGLVAWLTGPVAEELGYHPGDLEPFPEREYGLFRQLKNLRKMQEQSLESERSRR